MSEMKLAFLTNYKFENDGAIRGAILVTDASTKPLEFRVTAPIRPTNLQKTLYGKILDEHLAVELISIPLLDSLKEIPDLIIVRDALFLGVGEKQSIPVVRLYTENEPRYGNNKTEQEKLTTTSGAYDPVFLETTKQREAELPDIRKKLSPVFAQRNLIEPFARIQLACQQVQTQKVGE